MSTISLADARSKFSHLVDSAASTHERFEITRNGERVAVLMGADDFDAMIETFELLADRKGMGEILAAMRELQEGKSASSEQMREIMGAAGRLRG